jgi:cell division protein FtsN
VLETVPLRTGGAVAVCTRGDGSATGWISPRYAPNAAPGAALRAGGAAATPSAKSAALAQMGGGVQTMISGQPISAKPRAPVQYEAAWQDDRLNPLRGLGTQTGWASQSQVWTNTVPAQDVAKVEPKAAARAARKGEAAKLAVSSRSYAPAPAAPAGAAAQIYVQVGTFGQPSNAQNAVGRLAGLGLPVATSRGSRAGQQLVVVLAGPFGSLVQAQSALGAARGAGFGDAFLR